MENALALPEDNKYNEQLAELMGQRQSGGNYADGLTRVRVNKHHEDDEGNPIPPATFHVAITEKMEDGTEVTTDYFKKTATFRVF